MKKATLFDPPWLNFFQIKIDFKICNCLYTFKNQKPFLFKVKLFHNNKQKPFKTFVYQTFYHKKIIIYDLDFCWNFFSFGTIEY